MERAPATYRVPAKSAADYRVPAKSAADELDYADMVVLAETFVHWALEESKNLPSQRTGLMEIGIDYENLAEWVGPGWKAADPSDRPNPLRMIAELHCGTGNTGAEACVGQAAQKDDLARWMPRSSLRMTCGRGLFSVSRRSGAGRGARPRSRGRGQRPRLASGRSQGPSALRGS